MITHESHKTSEKPKKQYEVGTITSETRYLYEAEISEMKFTIMIVFNILQFLYGAFVMTQF